MVTLPRPGAGALLAVPALLLAVSGCSFQGHVSSGPTTSPPGASASSTPPGSPGSQGSPGSPDSAGPAASSPATPPTRPARPTASRSATAARTSASAAGGRSTSASVSAGGEPSGGPATDATTDPGPSTCPTEALQVSVGRGGGGSAGSVGTAIDFVNTGAAACVLKGHPGVSYVAGDDGHRVGASAARDASAPTRVVLAPGGRAHATLQIISSQGYDPATCRPTPVAGYRIYPPDQTTAAFVARPGTACSDQSVIQLSVGTVQSGSATS